jgi:endonuclease/exonuclease/phosphatase (EEP) superfamily protein YafD
VSDGGSFVSGYFTTPSVRAAEIEGFFARLDPALPALVAGDFNEGADGPVTAFLERKGFASALPRLAADQPTWRWGTFAGTLRKQLDHVAHDARLAALAVTVLPRGRSDHLPVVVVFGAGAARAGGAP